MKSKWWALAVFSGLAFAPAIYVGVLTGHWLLSPDFGEGLDCWLEPDQGHWMTPNEVHMMILSVLAPIGFIISILAFFLLVGRQDLSRISGGVIGLSAMVLTTVVFAVNAQTNDGYIDRLYEACGRIDLVKDNSDG